VLRVRERAPIPFPSIVFTFEFVVESIKELGGVSLGVLRQNDIWVLAPWPGTKNNIRGRWWFPPNLGRDESCEFNVFTFGFTIKSIKELGGALSFTKSGRNFLVGRRVSPREKKELPNREKGHS
jgi:hypothetical protein